jgi:response regulator RpfG family c-di-GMP phosphodiesterase
MQDKILFVDDEIHILESMKRQLRKRFQVETALNGSEALEILKNDGPFPVIVSDMRMPGMDGIELLSAVKEMYPDTVRLMLTGNADQETAIEAVNKGQIFRFLNKPCPTPTLITSLALALRQYRLVTAEKELLDKTLKGSIKVLTEILSFTNPAVFSSGTRIHSVVMRLADVLQVDNRWQLEIASLMFQIGCISLPGEILNKLFANKDLNEEEKELFEKHPKVGADLLKQIPRMKGVTYIIANHLKPFSDYSSEENDSDDDLVLSAQIIKAAFDYDLLLYTAVPHPDALRIMKQRATSYNAKVLDAFKLIKASDEDTRVVSIRVGEISIGMIVEENITAKNGTLLAPKGQEITWPILQGLLNFSRQVGVIEPVRLRTATHE